MKIKRNNKNYISPRNIFKQKWKLMFPNTPLNI